MNIVCRTFVTIPFLVLLFSLLICGCTKSLCPNKTIFEEGYDDFTADIEEHYSDFDDADWKRLNVDFKHYVNHCYSKYKEEINDKIISVDVLTFSPRKMYH